MDLLILLLRLVAWMAKAVFWLVKKLFKLAFNRSATARNRKGGAHGSARWATRWEQLKSGALTRPGLIVGRGAFGRLLRYTRDGLVMVFANTGAGKGIGIVVPTLLTYPGSIVVNDVKGENLAITRRHRATLGPVRVLAPLDLAHSDCFNPMDCIRRGSPMEVDDAASLARLLVRPDASESHWDDKASTLIKLFVLAALHEPPEHRTLARVRELAVSGSMTFAETIDEIAERSPSLAARDLARAVRMAAFDGEGTLRNEYASVMSNVDKATECWASTTPSGVLSSMSTFRLEELLEQTTTLYICVPEEFLDHYGRWIRVMVGCILNTLTREKNTLPRHKVFLLLDEARVLGRLEPLEKQAGLLRAYCTPILIWQNMPQLEAEYGKGAEAFLATSTCRIFFGIEDNATAHYVATMIGNTTTLSTSAGVSQSNDALLQQNLQHGHSESGYWLLDPAEVQRLPTNRAIVKMRGIPFPLRVKRIDYRKVRAWRGRWDAWRQQAALSPAPSHPGPAQRGRPAASLVPSPTMSQGDPVKAEERSVP